MRGLFDWHELPAPNCLGSKSHIALAMSGAAMSKHLRIAVTTYEHTLSMRVVAMNDFPNISSAAHVVSQKELKL